MSDLPDSSEYSDSNDFVIVDKANTHIDLSSEILKLSTWLQPTAYTDKASEFHKHLSVRAPGTGDWIEEIPEYRKWHDAGSHGVLWIKAIAGGGKSVLMASRIDRMQRNDPKTKVIFFFSRQVVTPNYGSHTLVRDWLDQLLPYSPSLQAILKARLDADSYCSATEIAFTELWQILTDALLAMTTPIYCVADALDELDAHDSNNLLSRLIDLGTRKPDLIKVLVSSRPLPQIQRIFGAVSTVISIRLENRLVNRDIARFIEYRLDQTTDLKKEICKKIKHLIEDHVFPSFLYARLMLDGLLEKHKYASLDIHSVQETMLSIPTSLEDLYSNMLNNHSLRFNVPRERQILISQLATHATRPLRLLEIATVLEFLETKEDRRKHENFKNLTRMSCGPLLEILPDETVSVIHHSFTEFLLDASRADRTKMSDDNEFPVIDAVETNQLMALICLRYLLSSGLTPRKHPEVSRPGHDPWRDMQLAQLDFPFVKYAACNWYVHVSRLPKLDGELLELLDTFINPEIPSYLAFLELVMVEGHSSKPTVVSPLHVCAWGHMIGYANVLLQSGHDCNTPNGKKMTPLASAASKGFLDMVSLLLQHGATPNPPEVDQNGKMPLHYAAQSNHHQVVKLLLEAGADPLVYRSSMYDPPQCIRRIDLTSRQSPLEYACQAGAVESVEAMLPYLTVKDLELALKCSIKARQFEIVKLFMDLPDIDTKAKELMKECLSLALEAKDPRILHFFLDLAATSGNTPPAETLLLTFCESLDKGVLDRYGSVNNAEMCLNLILQTGCDVNTRWETGRTPLHACVHAMCPTFVEKLLEHGADVHATDLSGNTPLHVFGLEMVLTESTAPILDALMRHGARWDIASNDEGLTPLLALCSRGWVSREDIEKLQPYVKDWNVTDKEGNTPIHLLLKGRADKRTLQKLIDLGADPNRHNNEGLAPLHCIQTIDQVRLLLSVGADLETKDYQGRTLLLRTILARDLSRTLPELLELGANVNATDYDGNGALHLLCEHYRQVKSLRILLDAGANPIHCNNYGDTLWHTFMRHALQGNPDSLITLVYLLRQTGIPLTIRNHYGQTLLHCMCSASITDPEILLNPPDNPIDHLHVMEVDSMLEVEDHQGRRPIHLAAAHSEALVGWLIHRGATLTGKTRQGENLLHIAAAARESNIVGLLLKNYTDNQQKNMAVNDGDKDGCTPLHIACRSGQLESVVLLLQAGADVHVTNKKKETPLHACAEFKRQPRLSEYNRTVCGEDETLRVADIISLLRAHNADLFAQNNKQQSPLDFAVTKQNTEMVIALADTLRLTPHSPRPNAAQLYLTVGDDHIDALVEKLATIPHNTIFECEQLLKLGAYRVLERLGARGVRMYKEGKGYFENSDFLNTLARWGFTNLFDKLGRAREGDSTDWINGKMSRPHEAHKDILPFIFTAANRSLPNLNLLQVIVETFHADVNVRMYETVEQPHHSVLHILAIGKHWWHTEAIKYVLERGADVMMRDAEGHTPLHIAVTGGYCRLQIARVLLEHGADANAFNHTGVTPLGLAAGNSEMVRLLLQHGGRVELGSKPILFEAITCQDIDSVRAIIESGFDIQQPFKTSLAELDLFKKQKMIPVSRRQLMPDADELNRMEMKHQQELSLLLCRPLHYASRGRFNKVTERHKAVAIVELLLSHGADPLLSYGENSTVIHDVLTQGGIVEPLLALPNLELETRDGRGRTLLLAACEVAEEDSLLLPQKHDNLELHPSGTAQKIFTVDRLCEMGAEVSVVDEAGNNPLHFLVTPGAYKPSARLRMSLLIGKCPALVHQQNQFGETPLHLAMKNHEWDLMRILLDASADASASDAEGNTVVHHIAGGLNADTRLWAQFRQFLEQGLEINARNHDGETPVFKYIRSLRCRESLRGPVFDGLVASGTDVFVRNQEGESLLHIVAKLPCSSSHGLCRGKEKFAESFSYLMELGLDPAQEDKNQRTPVDLASAFGKDDILALFKK